jgi:hypothetical protein
MTTSTTPTTELDAVNLMLSVIGESPLSTLLDVTVVDAVMSQQVLSEVSRTVQARGWHFNTEKKYPLLPDAITGEINVPLNCLRVDTTYPDQDTDAVHRGKRLYNRRTHTYQFTKGVMVDMVVVLPFEELPETARHYIAVRAAREFQARTVGSDSLYSFTAQNEKDARSTFIKAEGVTADHNILTGSWSVSNILQRR